MFYTLLTISFGFGIDASYSGSLARTAFKESNALSTVFVSPLTLYTN